MKKSNLTVAKKTDHQECEFQFLKKQNTKMLVTLPRRGFFPNLCLNTTTWKKKKLVFLRNKTTKRKRNTTARATQWPWFTTSSHKRKQKWKLVECSKKWNLVKLKGRKECSTSW